MKSIILVICALIFVMLTAVTCWSHGVDGYIEQADGYCATALYDDGEPMSYAAAEIKAPDSDIGFQTGRTDRNGRFVFRPDRQGRWQVIIKDSMGHRLSLDLEVGADADAPEIVDSSSPMTSEGMPRTVKVISGLCIIFGLSGFMYGWKARRTTA
jgi:nickel transport protein